MSTLLDDLLTRQSTVPAHACAPRWRPSASASMVRHSPQPDRRTEGRGRRTVRRRSPFPVRGQEAAGHSAPGFKAVTAVRGKVIAFWKSMSLPYPEPGIRLIRQDRIDEFAAQDAEFQEELAEAVAISTAITAI